MKSIVSALCTLSILAGIATASGGRTYASGALGQNAKEHLRLPAAIVGLWLARFEPPADMRAPTPGPTDPNGPEA
jgi:hypothetical protein